MPTLAIYLCTLCYKLLNSNLNIYTLQHKTPYSVPRPLHSPQTPSKRSIIVFKDQSIDPPPLHDYPNHMMSLPAIVIIVVVGMVNCATYKDIETPIRIYGLAMHRLYVAWLYVCS